MTCLGTMLWSVNECVAKEVCTTEQIDSTTYDDAPVLAGDATNVTCRTGFDSFEEDGQVVCLVNGEFDLSPCKCEWGTWSIILSSLLLKLEFGLFYSEKRA